MNIRNLLYDLGLVSAPTIGLGTKWVNKNPTITNPPQNETVWEVSGEGADHVELLEPEASLRQRLGITHDRPLPRIPLTHHKRTLLSFYRQIA